MSATVGAEPLLALEEVGVYFGRNPVEGTLAVDGVSLAIESGVSVGIVGESGSGKTTLLRVLAGLVRPQGGIVRFAGRPLDLRRRADTLAFRQKVQLVFQDPASSLDPRRRIWELVTEPAWALKGISRTERRALCDDLLKQLGLPPAYGSRRPHQLSGGERQRVALARALSTEPDLILLDEPVASLDASRRGQVINLINDLRRDRGVTLVVVSHDIMPVAFLTEVVVTMYRGRIVESGPTHEVLHHPAHPYTRLLVESVRDPLYGEGLDEELRDDVSGGCPYASRCPEYRSPLCDVAPELSSLNSQQHVACHVRIEEQMALAENRAGTVRNDDE